MQFNPSKSDKYGIQQDTATTLFPCRIAESLKILKVWEYYVPGIEKSAKYLLNKLNLHVDVQERNLTSDRLHTSKPLAK